jgi:hypothetical protein
LNRLPFLVLFCALLLPGCAYTYLDEAGTTHIVGLVSIRIPSHDRSGSDAATALRVTNIGISATRSDISSSLSIGYNSEEILVLGDNICVGFRN